MKYFETNGTWGKYDLSVSTINQKEQDTLIASYWMLEHKASLKEVEDEFDIPTSTMDRRIHVWISYICPTMYVDLKELLSLNRKSTIYFRKKNEEKRKLIVKEVS